MAMMATEHTISRVIQLADYYTSVDIPVFIDGPPGIGKTAVPYAIADLRTASTGKKWNVRVEQASLADPTDAKGFPALHEQDGRYFARWAQPDNFPRVDRDGEFGFFFLDEMNTGSPAVMASFMRLVLERKAGDYVMPAGWIPIGAGNRQSDRASANRLPSALANRFAHIHAICTISEKAEDPSDWGSWAQAHGVHPFLIAFLRYRPHLLHVMPQGLENAFPTPRAWEQVSKVMNAPEDIRQPLIEGLVGLGAAVELEGFLRQMANCPRLKEIEDSPRTARCFTTYENDLCFAVVEMLIRNATAKNFAAIVEYADRLPPEFNVSMVQAICRAKPDLQAHSAFIHWATRNKSVIL
jgi:hypothetical protein